jgi:YbgC/YbaW family acyl-CoA thioester hydrolase
METILKTKVKVRFQDCDPFNHLNNSKYIDYFLNVREDQLAEHYNIYIFKDLEFLGKSWVVTSNQINYIRPAHTLENVVIETQLIHCTNKIIEVEMKMWNENETEIKAILWTKFIYYDIKNKRIANHSEELMEIFRAIVIPVAESSFEERCISIIQNTKTKIH